LNSQLLLFLVFAYGGLLFAIAWLAERYAQRVTFSWWRPLIYTLSIGVYCSSWTFLGAVGTAVTSGWSFLPIYLGPILVVLFGWRFIRRLLVVSQRNKVTSVADFIGSRYGKSQQLAAFVTLVVVVGTLPYIALQLRAVGIAWDAIHWNTDNLQVFDGFTSFLAAMILAWFTILFGTRVIDGPDRLRGMLTVVAVESVVKLLAFLAVAVLAWQLIDFTPQEVSMNLTDSLSDAFKSPNFSWAQLSSPLFFTQLLLAASAIVCLPRQFHVMVVEYHHRSDLRYTRWLLPLYLGAFALFALPVAQAGAQLFSGLDIPPDSYVLILPRWAGSEGILALTFIGALSAATGMVVVGTIALSIMISNELIVPAWLHFSSKRVLNSADFGGSLRLIRRLSIVVVLLMSWGLEWVFSDAKGLASMGLISFAATVQLLPAILAALYWRHGHSRGVLAGLMVGMSLWFYCLLLPAILTPEHTLVLNGPAGIGWLSPYNLVGAGWLDPLSHGVFWSLSLNYLVFWLVSRRSVFSSLDLRQADAFTRLRWPMFQQRRDIEASAIEVRQLQSLMEPLFGVDRTADMWQVFERQLGHRLLPHDKTPRFAVQAIESDLAAIIGAVSAHRAMQLLSKQKPLQLDDFVSLVGGSSRQIQFSQTLLQTTLETIPQGISVVDKDLKLVAWNQHYQEFFDYPKRLLFVGCEIENIYRHNAIRGYLGSGSDNVDAAVMRRLAQLRTGNAYRMERVMPGGQVLEICGTPLANGGYVTTYTDISDHHAVLAELEESKDSLEERVDSRTSELTDLNETLQRENALRARVEKELKDVHASKSRFLAAASHDLLQPINAARLFIASLSAKVNDARADMSGQPIEDLLPALGSDVSHLGTALASAEQLISSLREISRLGSGRETVKREHFEIGQILRPLATEGKALAEKKELDFHWVASSVWVYSDPHMLRRVIQNFISNALRYTSEGRVLLGCRRRGGHLVVEVWDTGPGIAEENQQKIFEEFERLPGASSGNQGLGLGLSISQRIAMLLGHPLDLDSSPGRGSVFRIHVNVGEAQQRIKPPRTSDAQLTDLRVLCIDNEVVIQAGMRSLLEQWGCRVETAANLGQCLSRWPHAEPPALVLADYHLDTETGLDVLEALSYHWQQPLAAIVISADNSESLRERVQGAGYYYLSKPVQPPALRTLMRRVLRRAQRP